MKIVTSCYMFITLHCIACGGGFADDITQRPSSHGYRLETLTPSQTPQFLGYACHIPVI